MITTHRVICGDSRCMNEIEDGSVDLVITSPPYPMISMWDNLFVSLNKEVEHYLNCDGQSAFELMHKELDKVWIELKRVVCDGGIVCINIGDATRKVDENFGIYPNHCRIISKMMELGFDVLPEIIWHKPTNAPNKFMGSGMLPGGAYVTLEHEYILIFRKNGKRKYSSTEKDNRARSAYFWEERNEWFSDIWEIKGAKQKNFGDSRERTGAFPYDLPKRLILMYSTYGDTVLDPFWGTGTTTKVAIILGRNSIGYEIDCSFVKSFTKEILGFVNQYKSFSENRMNKHNEFIEGRRKTGKEVKHINVKYSTPVITKQETEITLYNVQMAECNSGVVKVSYIPLGEGSSNPYS